MRCCLAIIHNRNEQQPEAIFELPESELVARIVAELTQPTPTLWMRVKALFHPWTQPNYAIAAQNVIDVFKEQTTLACHPRIIQNPPPIDWRFTDRFRKRN